MVPNALTNHSTMSSCSGSGSLGLKAADDVAVCLISAALCLAAATVSGVMRKTCNHVSEHTLWSVSVHYQDARTDSCTKIYMCVDVIGTLVFLMTVAEKQLKSGC